MSQSLLVCDACTEVIPALKARLHCDNCVGDYNMCANCYLVGGYTGKWTHPHAESHDITMIEKSGYHPKPPPLPRRQAAPSSQSSRPVSQQPAALAFRPSPNQQAAPTSSAASPPVTTKPATTAGWHPLFSGSSPTKTYVAFLTAIFAKLDTDKDGLITPEQYSAFLDVQQYLLWEDVWKKNHVAQWVYTADDCADYENFSIQHTMKHRPGANTATSGRSFSKDMMPMLTLRGFIDITVIETLEWGDIPRSMLPQAPPKDLVDRVALVTRQSAKRTNARVDANARRLEEDLRNQEYCSRMLDPPGTRYYRA